MKTYHVITPTGLSVFEGQKRTCNAYLKQALTKGSPIGFLRIATETEMEKVSTIYHEQEEMR